MATISSRQHPLVKECRAIAGGDDTRLLLDGWHLVTEAVTSGLVLAWVAVDAARTEDTRLLDRVRAAGAPVVTVTPAVLAAMSPVRAASGIVAVASRPLVDPRALRSPEPALVLAAFGVQDPGNVGALVRSADAAGATGVLLDTHAADPWGWKALRAAMGSTFRLPVRREREAAAHLHAWQQDGVRLVAADPRGRSMYEVDLTGSIAMVMGAEGAGLPEAVLAAADARVRVPMRARVESLNVAVAAAVLLYEAARQRA